MKFRPRRVRSPTKFWLSIKPLFCSLEGTSFFGYTTRSMAKRSETVREIRLEKLRKLQDLGIDPYPSKYREQIVPIAQAREALNKEIAVAGRIKAWRKHGASIFADVADQSGRIQLWFQSNNLGDEFDKLELLDLGDFIGAKGQVVKTKAGETTVDVKSFTLLAKSLRPLPSSWHGLKDLEYRHRKRYLDLLMNQEVFSGFIVRSKIVSAVRNCLDSQGFMEVEVPVLQPIAGGATAKPFITRLEALDQEFYLRIAPELYLKRLLVGGYEKIYELGKSFRNEGFSAKHNPEYTLLEIYQAYTDYYDIMELVEGLLVDVAKQVLGKPEFTFKGKEISLKRPWRKLSMHDAILEKTGIDIGKATADEIKAYLQEHKVELERRDDMGHLIDKLFSSQVEENLIQPTFIIDLPIEVSPLAKKVPGSDKYVQRFELYIGGIEIANAYSELNDPIDQKERFIEQARKKEEGVKETHPIDEDFVEALEYGMPPAGGVGIGIDRLTLLFTDLPSLREVILFPLLKPEK